MGVDADLFLCYSSPLATWTDNAYFRYHGAILLRDSLGIWARTKSSFFLPTFRAPLGAWRCCCAGVGSFHVIMLPSCGSEPIICSRLCTTKEINGRSVISFGTPIQSLNFKHRRPISGLHRRHPLTIIYPLAISLSSTQPPPSLYLPSSFHRYSN